MVEYYGEKVLKSWINYELIREISSNINKKSTYRKKQ